VKKNKEIVEKDSRYSKLQSEYKELRSTMNKMQNKEQDIMYIHQQEFIRLKQEHTREIQDMKNAYSE
jgi:rRNA processing protein Gar1